MFPILFSIGPVTLYTLNFLVFIGLVISVFQYWRRTHGEHYEDDVVFDGILISVLGGVVGARIGYILFHLSEFGLRIFDWLAIFSKPGLNETFGIISGFVLLAWHAKRQKWDHFELLDFASIPLTTFFILLWIGRFFAGSHVGFSTELPIGVSFPSVFDTRHPVQIYITLGFILLFMLLKLFEHRYRFFDWYRANKQSAQAGFLIGFFLVGYGFVMAISTFFKFSEMVVMGVGLDLLVALCLAIAGLMIIYIRSGKWKSSRKKLIPDRPSLSPKSRLRSLRNTLRSS